MNLSNALLGHYMVNQLQAKNAQPVLQIGADRFTRADLAGVACFNFTAAANLSVLLNKHFNVKDLKDVYVNVSPAALALPRLGPIALAVLGAAFEAKGIGGSSPLDAWAKKHLGDEVRTFHTLKEHEQAEAAKEKKERRRRKQQRRDEAHRIRSERFLAADQPTT